MTTHLTTGPPPATRGRRAGTRPPRRRSWRSTLRRDWQLYSLAIAPLLFFAVFRYLPMVGNVIAFRQYQPGGPLFGTQWVGFYYFDQLVHDPTFWHVFTNTLILGGLTLLFGFPLPIILALLLNEVISRGREAVRAERVLPAALPVHRRGRGDHDAAAWTPTGS